ncbi:MAG: alpha-amylase family glycosyl hydrolase [Bacteroidota bacterium]|nr:alpha-amylase family glycosyl hydrolase [Bacteroidota bacterium]
MKYSRALFSILLVSIFSIIQLQAQLITTVPQFPVEDESVEVIFNATLGNGGLAGYEGDVYAHTGVITDESSSSSDWRYVKSDWGQNTPETKLTRLDNDLYQLSIGPNIRDYYGVPQGEDILQMAFVFRSEDSQLTGRDEGGLDIFVDVYEQELNVVIIQPYQDELVVQEGDEIYFEVAASFANDISLFVDGELFAQTMDEVLIDSIEVSGSGKVWVKAIATDDNASVADSMYYFVRGEVELAELPDGIRPGINYLNENSVNFCLTAPGKDFVFVIGDFNNWELNNEYFMKMTPDGENFWLEVDGLIPQQEYIFQYFVDGELRIADPYTEKTSDPWNDQWIGEDTYPGLIDYPAGKTMGIASVLQTAQVAYEWQVESFQPAAVEQLVIYELLIRDYTSKHTYQSLIDTLGYLERLGVKAIELMPVNEFEGNSSWGYNPSFYFAPDKYYGPKNDLKKFIDECHSRGIAVLIDMVLNHSYDQSPFVQLYFDGENPTEDNPWYNTHSNFTNPDAQWGNDFNHESLYTQQLIDSINSFWINEYKVDGFRFDFTKGFGNNIKGDNDPWGSNYDADRIALLKRMSDEIWERNPNTLVIFEHLAENSEEKELANYGILMWGNLNHTYNEATMGYHNGGGSDFSWIDYRKRGWNDPHVVGYMESHDEERLMFKNYEYGNASGSYNTSDTTTAIDRMAMASAFFIPVPGPKMIWQFGELGYDYSIDFNGRLGEKPVRWDYYSDYRRNYLYEIYSSLIHLKTTYDVFKTTDFELDVHDAIKQIRLNGEDMNVLAVGNFDVEEGDVLVEFQHSGMWYDYFTGDSLQGSNSGVFMTLAPGEYHFYTDVKLTIPETGTGIRNGENGSVQFEIYPNPAQHQSHLSFTNNRLEYVRIELIDYSGRNLDVLFEGEIPAGEFNQTFQLDVPAGMYFLRLISDKDQEVKKLLVIE